MTVAVDCHLFDSHGLCARKTPFQQISCTGVVCTKDDMQTEFVHRGGACDEKHHSHRFRAGVLRTKNIITTDFVHRGRAHEKDHSHRFRAGVVRTKNIIKTDFVHRGCAHEKCHSGRFRARPVVRTKDDMQTDFVHRGCAHAHERRHADRFRAQGWCARKMSFPQISRKGSAHGRHH